MDAAGRLDADAARRHGVITRSAARRAGLTDGQVRRLVAQGRWRAEARDVFVVAGAPRTARQTLLVASLRHAAAASHSSAAWLHGLLDAPPPRPHVSRSSMTGTRDRTAVLHRLADLRDRDVVTVDSISATSATRTLLDLGTCSDAAELRRLIDRARRLRLTHPHALVQRFVSFGQQGRRGAGVLREVLTELDDDLALVESDLETILRRIIVAAGLPPPVPQHVVHVAGRQYRLDFAYPSQLVAIEGDGFEFHSQLEQFDRDRARQNDLVLAGWLVLRFSWRHLVRQPEWVAEQIAAGLRAHPRGDAQR